jgi:KaiC/GvpD/RAD55 family RecA-like ATPase
MKRHLREKVPFDIELLNKITKGGLSKKTLNIALAGTGVGKSLFMCHVASSMLLQGKNVLYITLEMAEEKIAERIENLLGLAATTNAVENWMWDKVAERFVFDEEIFEKLRRNNIYATKEILERLIEAERRGYWETDNEVIDKIIYKYLELEGMLEEDI